MLDALELGYDDARAAAALVGSLHAPALRRLALEDASCPGRSDQVDAAPLLLAAAAARTSFPRVRELALQRVDAPAEAFEALYGAMQGLRSLEVSGMFLLGGRALAPGVEVAFAPPEGSAEDGGEAKVGERALSRNCNREERPQMCCARC